MMPRNPLVPCDIGNLDRSTNASRCKRTRPHDAENIAPFNCGTLKPAPPPCAPPDQRPKRARRTVKIQVDTITEEIEARVRGANVERMDAEAEASALQVRVNELEDDLRGARSDADAVRAQRDAISKELGIAEDKLAGSREECAAAIARCDGIADEMAGLSQTVERLRAESDTAARQIRSLREREQVAISLATGTLRTELGDTRRELDDARRSHAETVDFMSMEHAVERERLMNELYERTQELCNERSASLSVTLAMAMGGRMPPSPAPTPARSPARTPAAAAPEAASPFTCAVCLAGLSGSESLHATECGHTFHTDCIRRAMAHSTSCPVCRASCQPRRLRRMYM